MTTLPQMSLVLPTRGVAGAGLWGDTDDANLAKIDSHRHVIGEGTAIPTAGININADLSFSSLYAPINLHRITFASIVALSSNNQSLFVGTDHELYWRTNSGTNVKLTASTALNVAAFVGGIGGDYTAVAAALNYDSAGLRYTFKGAAGTNWQRLASGEVRIFETNTADAVYVGLAAPAALVGSYTITLPLAAPTAGTRPVQMSTAGVLTAGDSDNMQVGGTLGVTGLITATAGVTAAANQHVTVSGTGRLKHGTFTMQMGATAFIADTSVTMSYGGGALIQRSGGTGAITVFAPIILDIGKRVTAIRVTIGDSVTGPTKLQASFISVLGSTAAITTIASSAVSAGNSTVQVLTIGSLTTTITSGNSYAIKVTTTTGTDINFVVMAEVDYDHP